MSSSSFGFERWDPNGAELILKPSRSHADPRSLKGKRVLVIGGSGSVGSHQVDGFAKAGAEVLLASRKLPNAEAAAKDAAKRVPGAKIIPVAGDLGTFDGAAKFADKVTKDHGQVDHVVVAIGSWWSGRGLWDVPPDVWQRFFVDVTTGYIASLHAWLPRLPEAGAMVWILGASGVVPVPGAGPLSMAQASLVMAQRVVEAETGDSRRLFSIVLGNLATRERPGAPSSWISADEAAEVAVALAARPDAPSQGVVIRHRTALDSVQKRLGLK
ncbi:11-beta-hydroxysteroid dehydrogenase-like 2 [Vanrija pseudolonga]|uniref:11-beta-hydroxysteroid dehydrogenase-like 2 n=1 Tax=Vanrija pseudolonga TaxID=143232 RepID=A0AAF1BPJ8_9TREE|nr:11-beta-hydroxysteroid dehydrogenase-like 2 [Vanrija pseudolonga]